MPSVSKAQQRFMGLVHAYKKGEVPASKVSKAVKDAAKSMKKKSTKDFAKTKHKGLPNKVRSENMNEDGHTDVASVERKLKLIIVDAVDTIKKLRSMSRMLWILSINFVICPMKIPYQVGGLIRLL